MKHKLSKISKDIGYNISDISGFLTSNGFECSEDPNEMLSSEAFETIKNNINAFLSKKKSNQNKAGSSVVSKVGDKLEASKIPIEIKIIEAASKEIKLTERIIGFTPFDWKYSVIKFNGQSSQPVEFNLFDEVISDLLLIEEMSIEKIGDVLGLSINNDLAEKEILTNAISDLKRDKMIDGDESLLWLTNLGKDYAKNGVKFSTFNRNFDLYFDSSGDIVKNASIIFSELKSEKLGLAESREIDLEEIRELAEHQAPVVHFPTNGYNLLNASLEKNEHFKAKVWVVLLENFRDKDMRVLVYDERQNKIIEELSKSLDKQEDIKLELLDSLISIDEDVEYTDESKSPQQIALEKTLIDKQEKIEQAIDEKAIDKIPEILNDVRKLKKHFDSIEFELELKRLFDETEDELWIISPWIKNATLKRIPFFERYINKGGKIFVAYSKPEMDDQIMTYDKPFNKLMELEKKYPNYFFLDQLEPFHYKNVWLRKANGENKYYSGSYNILSFFVKQNAKHVRQEKMTRMDWDHEVEADYKSVLKEFSLTYIEEIKDTFDQIAKKPPSKIDKSFLTKLKHFGQAKLEPFLEKGIHEFDVKYKEFVVTKNKIVSSHHRSYLVREIEKFQEIIQNLSKEPLTRGKKKHLEKELKILKNQAIDFPELENNLSDLFDKLNGARLSRSPNQHRFKKKKRR